MMITFFFFLITIGRIGMDVKLIELMLIHIGTLICISITSISHIEGILNYKLYPLNVNPLAFPVDI